MRTRNKNNRYHRKTGMNKILNGRVRNWVNYRKVGGVKKSMENEK